MAVFLAASEPLDEHARMEAFVQVPLRLLEQLADDEHGGGGAVAGDVVLGDSGARDHHRRGVLDLHLLQQHVAVLRWRRGGSSTVSAWRARTCAERAKRRRSGDLKRASRVKAKVAGVGVRSGARSRLGRDALVGRG